MENIFNTLKDVEENLQDGRIYFDKDGNRLNGWRLTDIYKHLLGAIKIIEAKKVDVVNSLGEFQFKVWHFKLDTVDELEKKDPSLRETDPQYKNLKFGDVDVYDREQSLAEVKNEMKKKPSPKKVIEGGLTFREAYMKMVEGKKISRPCFNGYWFMNFESRIIIHDRNDIEFADGDITNTVMNTLGTDWEVIE